MPDLIEIMKRAALEAQENAMPSGVYFGLVVSASPLRIAVEQKMTLESQNLILTSNVCDYETALSFDDPSVRQSVTSWDMAEENESDPYKIDFIEQTRHKITVYNALKEGEKVILLRAQGGQRFVVLDRAR